MKIKELKIEIQGKETLTGLKIKLSLEEARVLKMFIGRLSESMILKLFDKQEQDKASKIYNFIELFYAKLVNKI